MIGWDELIGGVEADRSSDEEWRTSAAGASFIASR